MNTGPVKIIGTGAGTGIKAATDVDKEHGDFEAGGYPLIADWNDPRYIGHGLGHRDPKTGNPVPPDVHISTDGELNPHNYINTVYVEENPEEKRQHTRNAFLQTYNKKRASLYRANIYNMIGAVQCKTGSKISGERHLERARIEREAYNVDHSEIHFR
ncbi:hypothetical protein IWW48_004617 [Coemansia sp. RSA 1200]|nr:hypothetical protein IWW48_004617 [Coemansia sp. RSA 1200]